MYGAKTHHRVEKLTELNLIVVEKSVELSQFNSVDSCWKWRIVLIVVVYTVYTVAGAVPCFVCFLIRFKFYCSLLLG